MSETEANPDLRRALAGHAAVSLDDLAARARVHGPIDCNPAMVPPDMADGEALLADALEAMGVPVVPSRAVRNRGLNAALTRLRRGS